MAAAFRTGKVRDPGGNLYWACKKIGDSSGNIVGAMEKALENPDTWLKEHERKRSWGGVKSGVGDTLAKAFFGGIQ